MILESYPQFGETGQVENGLQNANGSIEQCVPKPELLLFSANTESSLNEQIRRHRDWIHHNPGLSSNVAYTRAMHREQLPYRGFAILDQCELVEMPGSIKAPQEARPVFAVFSGQGAQWPKMGSELILKDFDFRNDILTMDQRLKELNHPPTWNLMGRQHLIPHTVSLSVLIPASR